MGEIASTTVATQAYQLQDLKEHVKVNCFVYLTPMVVPVLLASPVLDVIYVSTIIRT